MQRESIIPQINDARNRYSQIFSDYLMISAMLWPSQFFYLFRREIKLILSKRSTLGFSCGFYLLLASLAPFALGPEPAVLAETGGGLLWLFFLVTLCLSLDRLMMIDRQTGSLAQIALSGAPLFLVGFSKAASLWLSAAIPLLILTPLAGLLLHLSFPVQLAVALGLLCGGPALCLTATLIASLTVASKPQATLLPLLLLPLYVPILILGSMATMNAFENLSYTGPLLWLVALSLLTVAIFPAFIGWGIKSAL